jgi:hypothetical protein
MPSTGSETAARRRSLFGLRFIAPMLSTIARRERRLCNAMDQGCPRHDPYRCFPCKRSHDASVTADRNAQASNRPTGSRYEWPTSRRAASERAARFVGATPRAD